MALWWADPDEGWTHAPPTVDFDGQGAERPRPLTGRGERTRVV
ncbi:hypothetical protein ACFY3M_25270 [Streptomyces mirabilis]